jgi:hypothetical protein
MNVVHRVCCDSAPAGWHSDVPADWHAETRVTRELTDEEREAFLHEPPRS